MMGLPKCTWVLSALLFIFTSCGISRIVPPNNSTSSQFEVGGITKNGEILIIATSISPISSIDVNILRGELLYDAIFKGIDGNAANRTKGLTPLVVDSTQKEDNMEYLSNLISQEQKSSVFVTKPQNIMPNIIRTSSGYKIKTTFILDNDKLRRDLEKKGVIKSFSNINQ